MSGDSKKFKGHLLESAATSLALLALAAPVYAQDQAPDSVAEAEERDTDVITITGIRGSIQNSLDAKRNSSSIIEAISAEDIGKLPDVSIADALARLPGVTAQRVRGRAQQVSIRGLGPDFSIALLNGREVVSAGNNRGIEFDQFPSELISQGIVYKTPDARLAATGIAGAVDLRTVRPLSYNERRITASGKYVLNDNGQVNPDFNDDGFRLFGSIIDQNADGTVGWSLALTHQSNPQQFFSRELKTGDDQVQIDPVSGLIYAADNPRQGAVSRDFDRTSVAGTLQFEPNSRFQATLDAFYTDTEDAGVFRGVETPLASWSGAELLSASGAGPFAESATYGNVNPILRTDTEGTQSEIFAVGLNTSYELASNFTVLADISHSTLDRSDIDFESYAGTGAAAFGTRTPDTLTFTTPANGEYSIQSQLDYTDPGVMLLTDPGGWGQVGFLRPPEIEDELTQIRLEAEYGLNAGPISSVVGGVLLTDREKSFSDFPSFVREGAGWVDGSQPIPADRILGVTDSGGIGFDIIAYDPSTLLSDGIYALEDGTPTEWIVDEDINTFYAMANIDTALGAMPLMGNAGFQYVDVTQSSTGSQVDGSFVAVEETYGDFLPSVNLSLEVLDNTFVRLAAARTVTRPRLDNLGSSRTLNFNTSNCVDLDADGDPDLPGDGLVVPTRTCYTLDGGNPFLQPFQSTSVDLAFERYFTPTSAIAIAFFHKDLSDWVNEVTLPVDVTEEIIAIGNGDLLNDFPELAINGQTIPVNFEEGSITGVEATLQMDLDDVLPPALAGFGFNFTYTYADASLDDSELGGDLDIPGYSERVWSSSVYYENHGFRARLNARHRSDFLSEIQQFDGSLDGQQALKETILDAQIGYEWYDGPLAGFTINYEAFNITDEPFATERDLEDASDNIIGAFPSRHELYGTTHSITVSKKF